jgi:hypothetical protein
VCDEEKKVIHVFGIRQRQKDPLGMFCGVYQGYIWKFSLLDYEWFKLPSASVTDRARIYQAITMGIISSLLLVMPERDKRTVYFMYENYAYGVFQSPSVHLLAELGGMLRSQLTMVFPEAIWEEKMAVSIKKSFTGSGKAKKKEMIAEYHRRGYPKLPSSAHPWEDMVDALAMVCCLRGLVKPANSLNSKLKAG